MAKLINANKSNRCLIDKEKIEFEDGVYAPTIEAIPVESSMRYVEGINKAIEDLEKENETN